MSYVAIWLQACLHWRCAYFQTLSWNETILLWIRTYCISCVVQQTSGVKDLSSLVRYDDSSLAVIRHVQSIVPIVRPRPNIRSHSVLFSLRTCSPFGQTKGAVRTLHQCHVSSRVPLARTLFTISPKWGACSQGYCFYLTSSQVSTFFFKFLILFFFLVCSMC